MMADDSSLPFEFPTPSFSFGACVNCTRKDEELQTLQKDQATNQANFKALKQKIIATDQLLRKFKAKTDECLKQEKDIEEWVRKFEKSQRELMVLEAQLRKALEDMEPVKRAKGELEKQLEKLEKEKEKLQTLLNEAEFLNNQYEMRVAGLESAKNSKEDASAESRRRHTALESRLKQRLNKINKLQTENKALKIEVTKHSRKEKRLETRLKRTENKLVKHLDVLVQHGLMTKKAKAKVMATVSRLDRNEDSDIGSLSDDDLSVSDLDTDPEDKEDKMNGKPGAVDEPLKSPDSAEPAAQNTTSSTSLDEAPTPPVQSAWPVRPPAARKKKGVHSVRKAGEPRTLGRSLRCLEELTARPLLSPLPVSTPPSPTDDRASSPEPFTAEDPVSTLTDSDDSGSETTLDQDSSRKDNSGSALGSAQGCLPVPRQKRSEPAGLPAERTLSPARDGEEGEHAARRGEKEGVTLGYAAGTPRSETMQTSVCFLPRSAGTSASVCSLSRSAGTSASVCFLPQSTGTSASVCSLPQSAGTSASVCSLPQSTGTSASVCSLPRSAGTSASVCSLPQSAGTSASVCSLPWSAGTSASVCSLPRSAGTSASVCSLPQSAGTSASVCSLPQSAGTSASVCSLSRSAGTSASVCSLPQSTGTSASVCSLPQSTGTSASVCSLPQSTGASASVFSLPQSTGTSASVCSLPQSTGTSASVCSLPRSASTSASVCSLPRSAGTSASVCSLPRSASVCSLPRSAGTSASVCSLSQSASMSASVCSLSQSATTSVFVCSLSQSVAISGSVCSPSLSMATSASVCSLSQSVATSASVCSLSQSAATSVSACSLPSAESDTIDDACSMAPWSNSFNKNQPASSSVHLQSLGCDDDHPIDGSRTGKDFRVVSQASDHSRTGYRTDENSVTDGGTDGSPKTGVGTAENARPGTHSSADSNDRTDHNYHQRGERTVGPPPRALSTRQAVHHDSQTDCAGREAVQETAAEDNAGPCLQHVHTNSGFQQESNLQAAESDPPTRSDTAAHDQEAQCKERGLRGRLSEPHPCTMVTRGMSRQDSRESAQDDGNPSTQKKHSTPASLTVTPPNSNQRNTEKEAIEFGDWALEEKSGAVEGMLDDFLYSSSNLKSHEPPGKSHEPPGKSHEAPGKRCSTSSEKENKDSVRKASPAQGRSALGDRQNAAPQQQGQQKLGQVAAEERKSFAHVQTHRPSPAPETAHERLSSSSSSSSSAASGSESEDTSDLSFSDSSLPPHTPSSGQGRLAGRRKTGKGTEGKQPSVKRREQLDVLQSKKKDAVLTGRKRKSPAEKVRGKVKSPAEKVRGKVKSPAEKVRGNVKSASDQGAPKSHVDTAPARSTPQPTTQNKLLQNTPQFTTKKIVQSTPQSMPAKASKQQTAYHHPDHIQDDSRADNLRTRRIAQKKKVPVVEDSESEEEETRVTKLSSSRLKSGRPRQRRKTKSRAVIESDSSDFDDDSSAVPLHPSMAGNVGAPPSPLPAQENRTTATVVGVCTEDPKRASSPRSQNDLHLVPPAGQSTLPAKESVATATASTKAFIEKGANLAPAETNLSDRAMNDVDTSKDGPSPGSDSSSQDSQFVPVGLCHRYFYLDHQYAARSQHAGQHGAVSPNPPAGLSTDGHCEISRRTERSSEDCDTGSSETMFAAVSQGAVCERANEQHATNSASTSMRQGVDCGKEQIHCCRPPSSVVPVKLNGCNSATMTRQTHVVCDTVALAGVSNTAVTGETLRKTVIGNASETTVIVAASENTVTGDISENAIAGDTSENTVTGDTSENAVSGDSLKNMVTGDMSENCVTGDMSENCVTGDTDSPAQSSDRSEQLSSVLSPRQHSSSQSLQARGDQHAVGKCDAGDQGQGLSESEGHHLRPCTELSISDIEADCAQRQAPSHPGVIRPEAIMLKSPVLELSSPPHPSAADTSLPVNMGDNSGGSRAVTDSAGKQVGLLSPLRPLPTSPLLIGGTDHSGSSPFKRVSSDRRRSSSINDDHGQDETDVPSLLTTASSNSAQKASVTTPVNRPVFCASLTTTSSNSASCSKVSSVNMTSALQVSVVMATHTSMSTTSLTKSTSSSRSYVTSVNCLLSSVSATKPTSFPSAVKSTRSSPMSSDVQRSEAGPVSHTHVAGCAWTTSEGEGSYDSFQSSAAFSQPAECVLVSSATSSISTPSVEAPQPDPTVSVSAPGGRLPDSRVAKCTAGPQVENQTGGLMDGGGSGDDCGGTDVERQPVEVSRSPAGASTERLRSDMEPGTVHRPQGDHLLPEVTSKPQGLEPRTRDHAVDICDRFCCVQHSISPLPSPQPFRECQKCLAEATPSAQNVLPQQPASMGRKKKKQKARQKKEMPLVSDAKKDAASQNSVIAASSSASQDSSTTTPNQKEAPAALSQGQSVTASSSSVSMQNQVTKLESPAHTLKGQQGHDVKVSLPANQKDGGQQGTGLLGAVERAKRDLRLRQQALSEDQRTSGSLSPSGSGSLTSTSHTGRKGTTKETGTAEGTTPQQKSCTDLTQTSMPTLSMSTRRKRKAKDSTSPASPPKRKGNVRCGKGAPAVSLAQRVQDIVGDYYCEVSIPVETVIGQLKQIGPLSDCWVPVVLTIVMLLKSENKDLQLDIVKACCGRGQQSAAARKQLSGRVFMDGTEIRFMHLLLRCMEVDSGCDRGRLMQMLWTSILSTNKAEKTSTTQRASLCRLYVGLCGSLGSAEEVRALAFKVVMMGLDGFVTIVLAIAAVWPRPLTRHKPSETTGGVAVIKHLVMSAIADNPVTAKLGQCFEHLCQWEPTSTTDAVSLMAQHIKALQTAFENGHKASSSPRAYELCRCVEMLCATNDALWVIKNFLERPVRSSLLKWASKGEGGVPPHMVVAMCRLVGRIMRPDLHTKKKVLTQLISFQARRVLFSPHKHPEVEAACVEMMLTLAPLKPPTIFGILQEYSKLYPSQLPLHLQDRVLAVRKLVNSRLQHKA